MPLRADKESISKYGRLIVDIANSLDSEHAIHSYLKGIKSIFNFSPNFFAEVSNLYPSLAKAHALLTPNDLDLISHITRESKLLSGLYYQFGELGYVLEGYNQDNNSLYLNTWGYIYKDELPTGHPEPEGPHFVKVCDLRGEIDKLLDAPMIYKDLDELMKLGCDIKELKKNASDFVANSAKAAARRYEEITTLHNKIDKIQSFYRSILDSFVENKNLNEIPEFVKILGDYNSRGTKSLKVSNENCLIETPLIQEHDYLIKCTCSEWERTLEVGFVYIFVEFIKNDFAYFRIKKCDECKQYYMAISVRKSKYCSKKCRAKFHNGIRIQSGEHREYKKRKRREGATESYYG